MNTTSTGEMTPDLVALEIMQNAPLKDSSSTYDFKTGGTSEKKVEKKPEEEAKTLEIEPEASVLFPSSFADMVSLNRAEASIPPEPRASVVLPPPEGLLG